MIADSMRRMNSCTSSRYGLQAHDRVADQLAGTVVGDAAASVSLDHVDPLRAVPLLAHGQLAGI